MLDFFIAYPYFTAIIILFLIWIPVFLSKSNKYEIFVGGVFFGFLGIAISKFYALIDYWHPTFVFGTGFPIEDFLYGFFYTGILATLHDLIHPPRRIVPTKKVN